MPDAVDVLFPLPLGPLTYLAPLDDGRRETPVGRRVIVPWQTGVRVGIVVGSRMVDAGRGLELRHALRYLGDEPYLQPGQLKGVDSIARGAGVPAGLVLATLGAPGLNPELEHEVLLRGSAGADNFPLPWVSE